jgi:hypothetical protein
MLTEIKTNRIRTGTREIILTGIRTGITLIRIRAGIIRTGIKTGIILTAIKIQTTIQPLTRKKTRHENSFIFNDRAAGLGL